MYDIPLGNVFKLPSTSISTSGVSGLVDILVKNGFVLTMRGEGVGVIEDGAVAVEGSRIVAVGKTHELERGGRRRRKGLRREG